MTEKPLREIIGDIEKVLSAILFLMAITGGIIVGILVGRFVLGG